LLFFFWFYTDLLHRSIRSIVLGAIFDSKLGPSLCAGQYERMRRVDDENDENKNKNNINLLE